MPFGHVRCVVASHPADRRAFLSTASAALAATAVAGCLSDDGGADDAEEPIVDVAEATASEGETDPDAWADVDEIRLDGYVGGWVGVSPTTSIGSRTRRWC